MTCVEQPPTTALFFRLGDDRIGICSVCDICGQRFDATTTGGQLRCIDHESIGGRVRGVLCSRCNVNGQVEVPAGGQIRVPTVRG